MTLTERSFEASSDHSGSGGVEYGCRFKAGSVRDQDGLSVEKVRERRGRVGGSPHGFPNVAMFLKKGQKAINPLVRLSIKERSLDVFKEPLIKGFASKTRVREVRSDPANRRKRGPHGKVWRLLACLVDEVGNKRRKETKRRQGLEGHGINAELVVGTDEKKAQVVL